MVAATSPEALTPKDRKLAADHSTFRRVSEVVQRESPKTAIAEATGADQRKQELDMRVPPIEALRGDPALGPDRLNFQSKNCRTLRKEIRASTRISKPKPEMKDSRTSTTGLDEYVRRSRRKKSACIQIDLDATRAWAKADNGRWDLDDACGDTGERSDNRIAPSEREESTGTRTAFHAPTIDSFMLHKVSRMEPLNESLRLELAPEERNTERIRNACDQIADNSGGHVVSDVDMVETGCEPSIWVTTRASGELQGSQRTSVTTSTRKWAKKAPLTEPDEYRSVGCPLETSRKIPKDTSEPREVAMESGLEEAHDRALISGRKRSTSENRRRESERIVSSPANERGKCLDTVLDRSLRSRQVGAGSPRTTLSSATSEGLHGASSSKPLDLDQLVSPKRPEDSLVDIAKRDERTRKKAERRDRSNIDLQQAVRLIREKIERKRIIENTIYRRINLIYEDLWENFLETYHPERWLIMKDEWMARKAEKRIEEEQRGLGPLDDGMEREVQKGTKAGAAKYYKEFEEKRAKERRRKLALRVSSRKNVGSGTSRREESRRKSPRLRERSARQQ
ncbi:uncharacterized protein LOC108864665 [Galendromus occidentalis]|uniref:Uncharacterized protein LOC108864665 n=1 Tax=Galendromus occidentalis TaxID=34638 RepID=A0AAJ7L5A7_9ACAR|nr:uncharacterized protein LOC108864665 [Galendromus occidentalis]